jgi:hypothetical protein
MKPELTPNLYSGDLDLNDLQADYCENLIREGAVDVLMGKEIAPEGLTVRAVLWASDDRPDDSFPDIEIVQLAPDISLATRLVLSPEHAEALAKVLLERVADAKASKFVTSMTKELGSL